MTQRSSTITVTSKTECSTAQQTAQKNCCARFGNRAVTWFNNQIHFVKEKSGFSPFWEISPVHGCARKTAHFTAGLIPVIATTAVTYLCVGIANVYHTCLNACRSNPKKSENQVSISRKTEQKPDSSQKQLLDKIKDELSVTEKRIATQTADMMQKATQDAVDQAREMIDAAKAQALKETTEMVSSVATRVDEISEQIDEIRQETQEETTEDVEEESLPSTEAPAQTTSAAKIEKILTNEPSAPEKQSPAPTETQKTSTQETTTLTLEKLPPPPEALTTLETQTEEALADTTIAPDAATIEELLSTLPTTAEEDEKSVATNGDQLLKIEEDNETEVEAGAPEETTNTSPPNEQPTGTENSQ